jgi:tyrosyl-tRNA synthetase
MFIAGGLGLNKTKIALEKTSIEDQDLLQGKYLLLQKGKKNYYLVIAE